jgi:xylulokinase
MANLDKPAYILAVDLGTSTCKASIISLKGEIKSVSCTDTPRGDSNPINWIELPEMWWQAAVKVIREAISKASISPTTFAGVGLCAFMHTPIGLDRQGDVITPTMIWYDTRRLLSRISP